MLSETFKQGIDVGVSRGVAGTRKASKSHKEETKKEHSMDAMTLKRGEKETGVM